jgi:GNAT superfamily N-acetyltransferase
VTPEVRIRPAIPSDVETILELIHGLAAYEREPDKVKATVETLDRSLFGERSVAEVLMAEVDGAVAGFALFYETFSTWEGLPGLWLEDLFVHERFRRLGIGKLLLGRVAAITQERGYPRLEWVALNWNTPAVNFYAKQGAETLDDWTIFRLAGPTLASMAQATAPPADGFSDGDGLA